MLGELTGYLVGISGSRVIPHGKWYDRAHYWIENYGFRFIAFFACIPNPLFDAIGLAAGTLRYSWWRFVLSCFLGKAVKFFNRGVDRRRGAPARLAPLRLAAPGEDPGRGADNRMHRRSRCP